MKKTLGLDLGTNSIGWALVEISDNGQKRIVKLGSRIVPMDGAEVSDFKKGLPQTKNAIRREKKILGLVIKGISKEEINSFMY